MPCRQPCRLKRQFRLKRLRARFLQHRLQRRKLRLLLRQRLRHLRRPRLLHPLHNKLLQPLRLPHTGEAFALLKERGQ